MSARRRQETLERFCVPIDPESSHTHPATQPERPYRRSRTASTLNNLDVKAENNDSFIDDSDYENFKSSAIRKSKSKSKGKAKATSTPFEPIMSAGENPKVMLISLKAGALGLNLTVANNVYL